MSKATRAKMAANVSHKELAAEFKKLKQDIHSDFDSQLKKNNSSLTRDLTLSITTELKSLFSEQIKEVGDRVESVKFDLLQHIERQDKINADLKKEINCLKMNIPYQMIWDNEQHQRNRHAGVRIHGFATDSNAPHEVLSDVYDALIKPSFTAAIVDRVILAMPSLYETVEYGHKLPRREGITGPPAILVKFASRLYAKMFLKYATDVVKKMNKCGSSREGDGDDGNTVPLTTAEVAAASIVAPPLLRVGRDLTPQLRKVMTRMYQDEGIEKVRLAGEKIQWRWKGGEAWQTCHNPFADDYPTMQIQIFPPNPNPLMMD
jgi:hypothetical protein